MTELKDKIIKVLEDNLLPMTMLDIKGKLPVNMKFPTVHHALVELVADGKVEYNYETPCKYRLSSKPAVRWLGGEDAEDAVKLPETNVERYGELIEEGEIGHWPYWVHHQETGVISRDQPHGDFDPAGPDLWTGLIASRYLPDNIIASKTLNTRAAINHWINDQIEDLRERPLAIYAAPGTTLYETLRAKENIVTIFNAINDGLDYLLGRVSYYVLKAVNWALGGIVKWISR